MSGMVERYTPPAPYNNEKYSAIRLLWIKVIIRAAYDYTLYHDDRDLKKKKWAQDAAKWLFDPSTHSNGFENICYLYNLSQDKIREYARKLTKDEVKKIEFRERNGKDLLDYYVKGLGIPGKTEETDGDER